MAKYYYTRPHLSPEYGFDCGSEGEILIRYFKHDFSQLTYTPKAVIKRLEARRTVAPAALENAERVQAHFTRVRLTPEQAQQQGYKYKSPTKNDTEEQIDSPLYFPLALRNLAPSDTLYMTEGEIKAHIACLRGMHCIAFAGIMQIVQTNREHGAYSYGAQPLETLKPELVAFMQARGYSKLVLLFDQDARTKDTALKRMQFQTAAVKFFRAWFADSNPLRDTVQASFATVSLKQAHKGLDDMLLANPNAPLAALLQFGLDRCEISQAGYVREVNRHLYALGHGFAPGQAQYFLPPDGQQSVTRVGRGCKYVSQAVTAEASKNAVILAQTGTGKTSFVYSTLVNQATENVIVCVPLQSQVEGFITKAADRTINPQGIEPQAFYEHAKPTYDPKKMPRLIVTTYDSLPNLVRWLSEGFGDFVTVLYRLVLDEAHNFVTSTNKHYKLSQYTAVAELMDRFGCVTALTGTYLPVPHRAFQALKLLEFNCPARPVPLRVVQARSVQGYAALRINSLLAQGIKVVCLFNNKRVRGQALFANVTTPHKAMINSDNKQSAEYQSLVNQSTLGRLEYVQATKLFQEGLDIFDQEQVVYIVLGQEHPADIWQLVNRHRTAAKVACEWIVGRKGDYNTSTKLASLLQAELGYSQAEAAKWTQDPSQYEDAIAFIRSKDYFAKSHVRSDDYQTFKSDSLELANTAFAEQRKAVHNTFESLVRACQFWGFDVDDAARVSNAKQDDTEEAERLKAEAKTLKETEIEQVKAAIRRQDHASLYLMHYDFAREACAIYSLAHIPVPEADTFILQAETVTQLALYRRRKSVAAALRKRDRTKDADMHRLADLRRKLLQARRTFTGIELFKLYNEYAPRKVKNVAAAIERVKLLVDLTPRGSLKKRVYEVSKLADSNTIKTAKRCEKTPF